MVRPARRSNEEMLVWAAGIVRREQESGTFGTVVIFLEKGVIVRAKVEKIELPIDPE